MTAAPAFAQTPPPTHFTQVISRGSTSLTVDFTLRPIRHANFDVLVQQEDGSFTNYVPDVPRTYLGTVRERPGALAAGLLRANGTLWARISFEEGATWVTKGGTTTASGYNPTPQWPTSVLGEGGAGTNVFGVEVGIDATYNHFNAAGGTLVGLLDGVEFSIICGNLPYLRDAGIEHQLGKLVVRASQARDPYVPDGSNTSKLLERVRAIWNNQPDTIGTTHKQATVIHSGLNGGLAYVGTIGTIARYAVSDSDNNDFSIVWRHEAGHNWGASHFEGGGQPEGATIMSGNSLSRFSSSELVKIVAHRKTRGGLQYLGHYPLPLPPRANQDTASFLRNTPVTMDVLRNDSDMNGEALTLVTSNLTTTLGGTVVRLPGAGSAGQDLLQYTPPPTLGSGTDWFQYRIQDTSGMQAVGFAMVRPRASVLTLADHWRLDDGIGTVAVNQVRSSHNGTLQNGVLPGQPGATLVTRKGMYFDGVDDRISIPAPNYDTVSLTITAWIKRNGNQNAWAPVVFSRAGSTVAGFGFGVTNELRYHWDNTGYTWQPSPALVPPDNEWCLVALRISSSGAQLFLRDSTGLRSAVNAASHVAEAFNGVMYLGYDSNPSSRYFKGWMDDVRVYKNTLTAADIESLYQQAMNPPAVAVTWPTNGAELPGLNLPVAAEVSSFNELVDKVEFVGDGTVLASDTTAPYATTIPTWAPGERTLVARASFGDWGYQVDSAPVVLTVAPPYPPVVSVTASPPASKWGPTPGSFTFTRDHGYGAITVGFTLSGNAVAGVDYEPLPTSVTFTNGQLTQTLVVMPIAAPQDTNRESLTLTLSPGAGYTVGAPAAATLVIGDFATYVWTKDAGGSWDVATNWDSHPNVPVWGPDTVADFSQVNLTGNRDLNLGSTGKVVGRLKFGDTTPSHQWDIIAQNGPLTLETTLGQPVIETKNWQAVITVRLAGNQGFEKTGFHTLRLDNTANDITGEIRVSQGTLQLRNGSVNNPTAFNAATMSQRSLRVTGPGALDLPRLDATGTQTITWTLPAITLEQGGNLRFRNNNAATYNHALAAPITVGSGGGVIQNNNGSGVQTITLSGALTGSGALACTANAGTTRQVSLTSASNTFSGNWSLSHAGGGTTILRAAAARALGTGTVTVGNDGQLLNDHATGLNSLAGVVLDGTNATLKLNQPWSNSAAGLALNGEASVAEVGNAPSVIGNLSGASSATLRGTNAASVLTVNQTTNGEFAGAIGPELHLIKSGPAELKLSGVLDESVQLTAAQGTLVLAGEPAVITAVTQTGGLVALRLVDDATPPLTLTGNYAHTSGVLRVSPPAGGYATGMPYPLVAYAGQLTGQPPVEFTEPVPATVNYGTGSNSVITVTFADAVLLSLVASPAQGGTVSGGGFYPIGTNAIITATPAPGWQFDGWEGEGLVEAESAVSEVVMDASKTVTAHFITDYQAWARGYGLADADALPGADPDGDGMNNDLEFRFGFDPTDPESRLRLAMARGAGGTLKVIINRVIPEGTFVLVTATSPAGPWGGDIPVPVTAPEWNHEVPVPMTAQPRFFRLRYSP
ncbi:MAG: LamG-like jellyroll fold domain-containing protein [Limisphaerales bacterium]